MARDLTVAATMIEIATKYSAVPITTKTSALPTPAPRRSPPAVGERLGLPKHGSAASQIPVLQRPVWKDLDGMANALERDRQEQFKRRTGVQILVPSFRKLLTHREWRWRELREGGALFHYLRAKRAATGERWRGVARARAGFKQNNKSDLQLVASVPAYDFHRWRRVDKDFWKDPKNIKALKRDNPNHVGSVFI